MSMIMRRKISALLLSIWLQLVKFAVTIFQVFCNSANADDTIQPVRENGVKPFSAIPIPKVLPFFGTYLEYFRAGGGRNLHTYTLKRHSELGPLYRENNSGINVLFVGTPSGMQDIYKHETKSPAIFCGEAALYFNEIHNRKRGIFFMYGDEWRKFRCPMNKLILGIGTRNLASLNDKMQECLNLQLAGWKEIAAKNNGHLFNINQLICEAGLPGMAAFLMGRSYETYRSTIEADSAALYGYTSSVWKYNMKMSLIKPKWAHWLGLPVWKNFEKNLISSIEIGSRWVDQVVADLESTDSVGSDGLIHTMLKECGMEVKDVSRIVGDFVAGTDPEFIMTAWLIYVLGTHPEAQDKIFEELTQICGPGQELDHKDLDQTEYLRSCVKEVMRLYPVPCFTTRFLQQDAVVGGYLVPAGTLAALNLFSAQRDPNFFPDPDRFWPERWYRTFGSENTAKNTENDLWDAEVANNSQFEGVLHGAKPYMALGWGTRRGCLFRKVTLVRMHLFIGRFIQQFKFTCDEVQPTMISIMVPDRDLNLRVRERRKN